MKALRIDSAGRLAELTLAPGALPAAVGAAITEPVEVSDALLFWVDENGIAAGRAFNTIASLLTHRLGAPADLHGTVVITGATDPDGYTTALTDAQVADIHRRLRRLRVI